LKNKADEATRRYDLATAADLQHYAIPELTARLESLEAAKRATDATASGMAGSIVTSDAIAQVVANWSGIPITSLKVSEKQKLLRLEKILAKSVVGQPEAVKAVCDAIRLSRSGLSDEERPIAGFLFVGSSGVGKVGNISSDRSCAYADPSALLCRLY
jgi:ATP-dependent Clp protease ATP-binding subunit ClpB